MENILLVTSIIIIMFGILQIILFFKIWEMANDVRKIKNKTRRGGGGGRGRGGGGGGGGGGRGPA